MKRLTVLILAAFFVVGTPTLDTGSASASRKSQRGKKSADDTKSTQGARGRGKGGDKRRAVRKENRLEKKVTRRKERRQKNEKKKSDGDQQ